MTSKEINEEIDKLLVAKIEIQGKINSLTQQLIMVNKEETRQQRGD